MKKREQSYENEKSSSEAVIVDEPDIEGREEYGAQAGGAHGEPGRQRPLAFEIEINGHAGGDVDETEADAAGETRRQEQHVHRLDEIGTGQTAAAQNTSRDDDGAEAEVVRQRRRQRSCNKPDLLNFSHSS